MLSRQLGVDGRPGPRTGGDLEILATFLPGRYSGLRPVAQYLAASAEAEALAGRPLHERTKLGIASWARPPPRGAAGPPARCRPERYSRWTRPRRKPRPT
eukprot:2755189-Pyramimonas_sp.AAC.1